MALGWDESSGAWVVGGRRSRGVSVVMLSSEGVHSGGGGGAGPFCWAIVAKRRRGLGSKRLEASRTMEEFDGVGGRGEDGLCGDEILRQGEGILVGCVTG